MSVRNKIRIRRQRAWLIWTAVCLPCSDAHGLGYIVDLATHPEAVQWARDHAKAEHGVTL
jgi:enoyl-CoA hydratase/carnithine racemase